jgi:CHAD domain-containing protein
MAVRVSEIETKYEAPSGTALPLLAEPLEDLPEVTGTTIPEAQHLEAEYYDTAGLRLLQAGITLRRRTGGDDAGWHLKLPSGPQTRQELQLPGTSPGVPEELAGMVLGYTRGQPLSPVARISTTRHRLILHGSNRRSLAEVAADDVRAQTLGRSTTVSEWHEVEVELTGGDRKLLAAVDGVLRGDGLHPAAHAAKLERALGREPARPGPPAELTPASPAGQVVLAYIRTQAARLTALDPQVRQDEPDSVHQMRVTSRRLRAALRSFRRVLPADATAHLDAELKWLGGVLGEARDREVLPEHLLAATHAIPAQNLVGPVQARIQAHFAPASEAARAEVLAALGSGRYFALRDELDRLLASPPEGPEAGQPAAEVLPAAVRRTYRTAARRMRRAWHTAPGPRQDAALHQARKAVRRARYAAEAVIPVAGRPAGEFARQMKRVQSLLGDHQDSVLAGQVARQLGMSAHLSGENGFSYGLLHEHEAQSRARLRARAREVWQKASRRRYRKWARKR